MMPAQVSRVSFDLILAPLEAYSGMYKIAELDSTYKVSVKDGTPHAADELESSNQTAARRSGRV